MHIFSKLLQSSVESSWRLVFFLVLFCPSLYYSFCWCLKMQILSRSHTNEALFWSRHRCNAFFKCSLAAGLEALCQSIRVAEWTYLNSRFNTWNISSFAGATWKCVACPDFLILLVFPRQLEIFSRSTFRSETWWCILLCIVLHSLFWHGTLSFIFLSSKSPLMFPYQLRLGWTWFC